MKTVVYPILLKLCTTKITCKKITEFTEIFLFSIFLRWEEQAGKAISTGDIVNCMAGLWKIDTCYERIIILLPALGRWKAFGYPDRGMILLCNPLVAGHFLWRSGEERSTHSSTNFLCQEGWWCNFAAVKCTLKGMKSVYLQKQNYSYDFWYILKPFRA